MTHTTGRWLFGYGVALLIFAAVLMVNAETEVWQAVALVVALLGGYGLGTGMAVMMIPGEHDDIDVHYDADWDQPSRDFPTVKPIDRTYNDPMRTPPQRWEYPAQVVCLTCGKPGCTGEPCVNS